MHADLKGKTVVVTGATSGIGCETARAFVEAGSHVVLSGINAKLGEQIAAEHRANGGEAIFVSADVTLEDDIAALVEAALKTYGSLDVAFNNAGTIETPLKPVYERDITEYQSVFDTNVRGVFFGLKYQIPVMLRQGKGAIINNASVGGTVGVGGIALYVASKHAVIGLTKSAAVEVAQKGIRINALMPDATEGGMIDRAAGPPGSPVREALANIVPMKRIAAGIEQGRAVTFLASDAASFITGATLAVDGGRLAGTSFI